MGGGFTPATDLYVLPVRRADAGGATGAAEAAAAADAAKRGAVGAGARLRHRDRVVGQEPRHQKATVIVALDGGNEFGDYVPGAYIDPTANVEDQVAPPTAHIGAAGHRRPAPPSPASSARTICRSRRSTSRRSRATRRAATSWPRRSWPSSTARTSRGSASRAFPRDDVTPAHVRYQFNLAADAPRGPRLLGARARSQRQARQADRQEPLRHAAATLAPPVAPAR